MSNKKRSKFMNHGQFKKVESSDDKYRFVFLQHDVICSIQEKLAIPKTWILLNSQSTIDVFSNPTLLTNIRNSKRSLTLYCNVGNAIKTNKGDLKGYGTLWFYPEGSADILSLGNVQKKHSVMYESTLDEGFLVFQADSTAWSFRPSKKGLSFSDVKGDVAHTFINTVEKIKLNIPLRSILMLYAPILHKIS